MQKFKTLQEAAGLANPRFLISEYLLSTNTSTAKKNKPIFEKNSVPSLCMEYKKSKNYTRMTSSKHKNEVKDLSSGNLG